MKYEVDNKHREFFSEFGWLECEHVLSAQSVQQANQLLLAHLAQRLHVTPDKLDRARPLDLFCAGRDIWRQSANVKSVVCQRVLAEIAAQLVQEAPLRMGYDHLLTNRATTYSQPHGVPLKPATLTQVSSIQGLLCGVIIALAKSAPQAIEEEPIKPIPLVAPIPREEGSCVFVTPQTLIDFPRLVSDPEETYLLIAYCEAVSCFVRCDDDLCAGSFKSMGYSYGDRLVDQHHPVIYHPR